ncbi:MAG: hypothetical protein OXF27_19285 [Acidobacteria bacterium]|nr:hypothetical protein [Acidobacteriota bacterium]
MPYRYLLTMLAACAVLAASAGSASAQAASRATATFSRTDVRIVEASTTTLEVRVAPPEEDDEFPALGSGGEVVLEVEPAAVVTSEACDADEDAEFALRIWSETDVLLRSSETGAITVDRDLRDYEGQPAELRLTACENRSDFRDASVTLALRAASLMTQRGNVAAGPPAVIHILNDDPVPVVEFTTGALAIDEGGSQTVAIVADGDLAGAVMQVAVDAAGDALISMQQRDQPLDESPDGSYTVDLGASGTAVLTVLADADDTLASGETKTATVRIVDANGAEVGDIDTLTVTVSGTTDVPALPLAGLLLQALLLTGVGARLYRRRRG